jgi:hypothetical protein
METLARTGQSYTVALGRIGGPSRRGHLLASE